jgi:hypothetical protein
MNSAQVASPVITSPKFFMRFPELTVAFARAFGVNGKTVPKFPTRKCGRFPTLPLK